MNKRVFAGIAALILSLLIAADVWAFNKVYSPIVEKGELELEYQGSADFDRRTEFKNAGEQDFEIGYGVTDRWFTEVEAELDRAPKSVNEEGDVENHSYEYGATSWENVLQLTEQGQYFVDLGLFVEYGWAGKAQDTDHLEIKILLEKQIGDFIHRLNINFEKETGGGDTTAVEPGFAWQTLYRLREEFQPGFEIHSNFGPVREQGSFEEQEHLIGPVVAGHIFHKIKYNVGYLFGITDNTPRGELKWTMEWEQRF